MKAQNNQCTFRISKTGVWFKTWSPKNNIHWSNPTFIVLFSTWLDQCLEEEVQAEDNSKSTIPNEHQNFHSVQNYIQWRCMCSYLKHSNFKNLKKKKNWNKREYEYGNITRTQEVATFSDRTRQSKFGRGPEHLNGWKQIRWSRLRQSNISMTKHWPFS